MTFNKRTGVAPLVTLEITLICRVLKTQASHPLWLEHSWGRRKKPLHYLVGSRVTITTELRKNCDQSFHINYASQGFLFEQSWLLSPTAARGLYKKSSYFVDAQGEDVNSDSDEEPSPEALARYLAMRRHTVGVETRGMRYSSQLFTPLLVEYSENIQE